MRFAAATTLYGPTEAFVDNLLNNADTFPLLFVYDNSSDNTAYVDRIRERENIIYNWDGVNHGLPEVFNRALAGCRERDIDFLCMLDQDSVLDAVMAGRMEEYLENHDTSRIGAVGTCRGWQYTEDPSVNPEFDVDYLICSGTFINLRLMEQYGIFFDEAYFVDRFDADLCFQMKKRGLRIFRLRTAYMAHSLGDNGKYSKLRNYYIFRNRFYFNRKNYGRITAAARSFLQTVKHALGLLKEGEDGREKLKALKPAWRDYRHGRMGAVSDRTLRELKGK